MSVLGKKENFKDIKIANKEFISGAKGETSTEKKRGRTKMTSNKRDKIYAFHCTQKELDELKARAEARYLSLSEYFRVKLFSE
ncbi:hypothetical protein [Helicobacter sp. MIT 05-5294]|uniref:plasmid mobilization protein n=1 Tax=Helicobacter sp. MIT 05-5294 TaxID=1548150 RepID=UPI00051FAA41|nr:hypothetical protein [Helicobacter sp. MIT 05-5294]TLD85466.1 hypothetical protein LS69_009360 [Helicobacter sp. MIT 05-5294]